MEMDTYNEGWEATPCESWPESATLRILLTNCWFVAGMRLMSRFVPSCP